MSATLANNRQLLLDKLAALDTNGQHLRTLLRSQHDKEVERERIAEHRQQLLDQVKCLEIAYEVISVTFYIFTLFGFYLFGF